MGLKKIYYFFENKWYNFVEKAGLYKITDKIDKVMPSFILFILIIVILIAGIFISIPIVKGKGDITVSFFVSDDDGSAIPLVPIEVNTLDKIYILKTNDSGSTESLRLRKNSEIFVRIDYKGSEYEIFSDEYVISDNDIIFIYLDKKTSASEKIKYEFSLIDTDSGRKILEDGVIELRCKNSIIDAPGTINIISGDVVFEADPNCQVVAQSITVEGYEKTYSKSITLETSSIDLSKLDNHIDLESQTYYLNINVTDESGDSLSGMEAELYQNNVLLIGKSCTTLSGTCVITGLENGSYTLKVTDVRGTPIYGQTETPTYVSGNTYKTVQLTRNIAGYILVKVKKNNNQIIPDAETTLKYLDTTISTKYTDQNGNVLFPVYDITKTYRVIVDKEGYLIASQSNITPVISEPTNSTITITLQQITPQTAAKLNIRVINSETGKGFPNAQVVLYNSDTGFLTDYKPLITNFDGNASFTVTSNNYYAKAFKGTSYGISDEFKFDVREAVTTEVIIIPMEITKGNLLVKVVDKDGVPVPRANLLLFDRYNSKNPIWGGDLANVDGTFEITEIVSDQEVYVVVSDIVSNLGSTQSEFVYIKPNETNTITVTLYNKISSIQEPIIKFLGFYNESGDRLNGYLRNGAEYKAKFLLFVPSERRYSDLEEYEEVGAILNVGSSNTPYMENDSIFIKRISLPNAEIQKFTQYSSKNGYDGKDDVDSKTDGDAKWVKIIFNPIHNRDFATAYTIVANLKIKEDSSYGEKIDVHYLGYGYTENEKYETDPKDDTRNKDVEYMTYKTESFNIGEEQACSDEFCFTLNITNLDEDLRNDVIDFYTAKPQQHYKLRFGLINNNNDRIYTNNSRFEIKNEDKSINFKEINILQPNSSQTNISTLPNTYKYTIPVMQFNPHNTLSGEILFVPNLKGDAQLLLQFVSDQKIIFTRFINIHVLSDKSFLVNITPEVVPSGKNFNLDIEVKDDQTQIEVENQVFVSVKDRFKKNLISDVLVGALGKVSITNIPGQENGNKVYIYVQSSEYETHISEIEITDNIYQVVPSKIGVSLNINTKTEESTKFIIENLSENTLIIDSIKFIGDETKLESLDLAKINNVLSSYQGLEILGKKDDDSFNNKKEIETKFFISTRANMFRDVKNLSSKIVINLRDKYNKQYIWIKEVPVTVSVGYDGLMDNSNCISLSEGIWETSVVDSFSDTQFILKNNCGINQRPVPLTGGLSAKVEFEGNPLGTFTASVGSRKVELSSGYFKSIYDIVDSEKSYTVDLRYTPNGRYTGDIKGKIIFRSVNNTDNGSQELLSEYNFILHVVSLKDCYSISKKIITVPETGEENTFVIENKGCGSEIVYRLSCDECNGLVISPREEINVSATGSSEEIIVKSMGAMPGIYLLNVYSKVSGMRGQENNVGKIRVEVRPVTQCLDLDIYEFDLFRYEYSENTGQEVKSKSFDTANLINRCYGQEVKIEGKVSSSAKWSAALLRGLTDGLLVGVGAHVINNVVKKDDNKTEKCGAKFLGIGGKVCLAGQKCENGKCVLPKLQLDTTLQAPKQLDITPSSLLDFNIMLAETSLSSLDSELNPEKPDTSPSQTNSDTAQLNNRAPSSSDYNTMVADTSPSSSSLDSEPILEIADTSPSSSQDIIISNSSPPLFPTYYRSASNQNTRPCSEANLSVGKWGCVCVKFNNKLSVVSAKCASNNTLVLYSVNKSKFDCTRLQSEANSVCGARKD